jgi:hypothetical protein
MHPQELFDYFNFRGSSGERPSVVLMNHAAGYTVRQQTFASHIHWLRNVTQYFDGGKVSITGARGVPYA